MDPDPKEHARQMLAHAGVPTTDAELERMERFLAPQPPRKHPQLATEPQLVHVLPEDWR